MSIDAVVEKVRANREAGVARLVDWLKIPSVGTDPQYDAETRRAGEWCRDQLIELGVDATLRETGTPDKPGHPIVYAEHNGGGDGPTVLFYGHYDVQPADPLELWDSPPFDPVIKGAGPGDMRERVVARGAVDDKGQVSTFLEALRAWKEATGEIPMNLIILVEGEEESGSANLEAFLVENKDALSKADFALISDTGMLGPDDPAITYGVRGLCYTEVKLTGPSHDLHSGLWGGRSPNPFNELTRILAQLWDDDRRVTLPGFYDGVGEVPADQREAWANLNFSAENELRGIGLGPEADANSGEAGFTALEREWARPTCDINGIIGGYTGEGAKTVIPSWASAKVSFRLVDDQDPVEVARTFKAWLEERCPEGRTLEFIEHGGGPPATADVTSPWINAARRSLSAASGKEAALIKSGGSIPVVGQLKSVCGLETVLLGFGLSDDRMHSPNEKFDLACHALGAETHARLIGELAAVTV